MGFAWIVSKEERLLSNLREIDAKLAEIRKTVEEEIKPVPTFDWGVVDHSQVGVRIVIEAMPGGSWRGTLYINGEAKAGSGLQARPLWGMEYLADRAEAEAKRLRGVDG